MSFFDRWRRLPEDDSEHDEAMQRLLERARTLPRESEPGRDLWRGIENRIRTDAPQRAESAPSRRPLFGVFPRPVLAATIGLALMLTPTLATLWLAQPSLPKTDSELRLLANELRDRDGLDGVHESLLAILETRRSDLPPEALLAIEDNLQRIDRALAELNVALRRHPEHAELRFLLAETYQREADLLARLEWWLQAPPGAQS